MPRHAPTPTEEVLRVGRRTKQLGLHLSDGEHEVLKQIVAHQEIPVTSWVTHVALLLIHDTRDPAVRDAYLQELMSWRPPTPARHAINIRIAEPYLVALSRAMPGVRLATMVRWYFAKTAPAVLATVSVGAQRRVRHAMMEHQLREEREGRGPKKTTATQPTGYISSLPTRPPLQWPDEPPKEKP